MSYRQFYVWELKLFHMFTLNFILKGIGEMLCGFRCLNQNRAYRSRPTDQTVLLVLDISDYFTGDASQKNAVVFLIQIQCSFKHSIFLSDKGNCILTSSCCRFVYSVNNIASDWKGFPKQGYWKSTTLLLEFCSTIEKCQLSSLTIKVVGL